MRNQFLLSPCATVRFDPQRPAYANKNSFNAHMGPGLKGALSGSLGALAGKLTEMLVDEINKCSCNAK